MACGKVTNVKLRLIKPVAFEPLAVVGQVYQPYWYRDHDMNRSPLGYTVVYFKGGSGFYTDGKGESYWSSDLSNFENAE